MQLLSQKDVTLCSADKFHSKLVEYDNCIVLGGYPPQTNERFMVKFEREIETSAQNYEIVLVDMSLVGSNLKNEPIQYFLDRGYRTIHVIPYATVDAIKQRIQNDDKRDQRDQQFALSWVYSQEGLLKKYPNDYKVDTTGLCPEDTAEKVVNFVFSEGDVARCK